MRLSARGFTLPWQLVELHEPGPVYLLVSAGGLAAESGPPARLTDVQKIAPSQTTAHRSVQRLASGRIFIRWLGWNKTPRARAIEPPGNRIFYTSRGKRSQRKPRRRFPR